MGFSISLIVAVSENGVIGHNGRLPWRIPEDLKHFKAITKFGVTIHHRKSFKPMHNILLGKKK